MWVHHWAHHLSGWPIKKGVKRMSHNLNFKLCTVYKIYCSFWISVYFLWSILCVWTFSSLRERSPCFLGYFSCVSSVQWVHKQKSHASSALWKSEKKSPLVGPVRKKNTPSRLISYNKHTLWADQLEKGTTSGGAMKKKQPWGEPIRRCSS